MGFSARWVPVWQAQSRVRPTARNGEVALWYWSMPNERRFVSEGTAVPTLRPQERKWPRTGSNTIAVEVQRTRETRFFDLAVLEMVER
jgi:hypothetical protein